MKNADELITEAHENIRRDRKFLEDLRDKANGMKPGEDPLVYDSIMAHIVQLTDSLTKANAQLVELAKLKVRTESQSDPERRGSEKDNLYDAIGEGFAKESEKSN